jgi:hypothetical protein
MGTVESIFKAPPDNYITGVVANNTDGEVIGYLTSTLKEITEYNFVPLKNTTTMFGSSDTVSSPMVPNSFIIKFDPGFFLINITKDNTIVNENLVISFNYITQNVSGQNITFSHKSSNKIPSNTSVNETPIPAHLVHESDWNKQAQNTDTQSSIRPEPMSYKSTCKTYITELRNTITKDKTEKSVFSAICPVNGPPGNIQIPENSRPIQIPENSRPIQIPENSRPIQIPENSRPIQIPENSRPISSTIDNILINGSTINQNTGNVQPDEKSIIDNILINGQPISQKTGNVQPDEKSIIDGIGDTQLFILIVFIMALFGFLGIWFINTNSNQDDEPELLDKIQPQK